MADNPPPDKSNPQPPLPASGRTGKLPAPTTQLPKPREKGGAGKIVVMLSSVAKPAPAVTQPLTPTLPRSDAPPKVIPADTTQAPTPTPTQAPNQATIPPLPPKQVAPAAPALATPKITSTTFVKLPPKTTVPQLTVLSGKPLVPPRGNEAPAAKLNPPALPPKTIEVTKKSGAQHIPPIKLNELSSTGELPGESIFAENAAPAPVSKAKPEGWKSLEPGELPPPSGSVQSLEVFARSQRIEGKPAPQPEAKDKPTVAPPLLPPTSAEAPKITAKASPLTTTPLPSPSAKPAEPASASSLHVAPPMLEKASEPHAEKLAQPHLPAEAPKAEIQPELPGVTKVPMLGQPEVPASGQVPPPLATKPPKTTTSTLARMTGWMKKSEPKKTTPLVVSSTTAPPIAAKTEPPPLAEAKPTLKPPVLPKRSLLVPKQEDVPLPDEEKKPVTVPPLPVGEAKPSAPAEAKEADKVPDLPASTVRDIVPPLVVAAAAAETLPSKKTAVEVPSPLPEALAAPIPLPGRPTPPPTRTEKAKKRRLAGMLVFWLGFIPVAGFLMVWGSFHFGVETRLEGQAIPPPGMVLSDEVWIVSDFRELSAGIAEDLAAERTPLMQEIQERQDHVQRAQADVASREERIRLIQQDIQASKDEIAAVVKQSRDATQKIWDGEGAEIDQEYQARVNDLQRAISDRAKSLKLNYQPDPSFPSPEVWANAYRLALYQVPVGVDSVKEHQWLGDQMKSWRDFVKTLDDRKEALREKAAQLKLEPAPKITDLNTKIDGLQQRADSTAAEEVPLKAELQQAQADLAAAQAAEAGLDEKYYKQLYALPGESVTKHIPLATNGRFSWVEDEAFAEGEKEHSYWIFARATRPDGRQYWALGRFTIEKNHKLCLLIEPDSFISTKAILRPNLSPEEQAQ